MKGSNAIPRHKVELIVKRYNEGVTVQDIAAQVGVSPTGIFRILRSEGVPVQGRRVRWQPC